MRSIIVRIALAVGCALPLFPPPSSSSTTLLVVAYLLPIQTLLVNANDEQLCTAESDGDTANNNNCEAVSFEPDTNTPSENNANELLSDDEEDDDDEGAEEDDDEDDDEHPSECSDLADPDTNDCKSLAETGECTTNPGFMKYQCASSCGTCRDFNAAYGIIHDGNNNDNMRTGGSGQPCTDLYRECKQWAGQGECAYNPDFMLVQCERSCMICFEDTNQFGVHQTLPDEDDEHYEATKQVINNSIEYMKNIWTHNPSNNRVNYKCRNMDENCSYWAAAGKCVDTEEGGDDENEEDVEEDDDEDDADYMEGNCAPACQTCHLLDIQLRCPNEEGNEPVYKPGMLNELFENIVDNADGLGRYAAYSPVALSRPSLKRDGSAAPEGNWQDGPWVVILENFISDEEAYELITAGDKKGFHRSMDVGIENPDGSHEDDVSDGRTSTNAWCDVELCQNHPVIRPVIERVATTTSTFVNNSEHLQLLRYEPGQYYRQHHDYIEYQQDLPCGVRMLTLFLYLNDVEDGGGTRFPLLDITVQPKKGRALLWPSVLDADPEEKDKRTDHEALPVISGIKFGANAWIHSRNYQKAEENDCT